MKQLEKQEFGEYLDLIVSVKLVEDMDEAIAHINRFGSSSYRLYYNGKCRTGE